jgi:hypothetical protein
MSILCSMVGATFTVAATGQVLRAKKTITAVGNAQVDTAQSQFGGASALFDGTGDYLTVTNIAGGITDDQTFEFWIRFANLPTSGGFRMVAGDGGGARYLGLLNDGGTYRWEVSFSDGQYVERFTTSVSTNTWYHVALTKSGSTLKMYQAGSALTSAVSFNTMAPEKTLFVAGTNYIGSWNTDSNFFNGHMDEIRVSNNVRYTTTFTPSTTPFIDDSNTVLLIHANGTDASTVFEDDNGITRSQNNFSLIGNARLSTARSKFGASSAYFDGSGDYAIAANNITFADNQDFTWEFWVNEDVSQGCKYIGGEIQNDIFIGHDPGAFSNRLGVGIVGVGWYMDFGESLALDTWYHLCVQRSGDTVYGYINGVLKVTHTGTLANWDWHWRKVVLGAETTGNTPFNGYLDEMRWSNIVRYATGGFTQPSAPFVNDANTVLLVHAEGTNNSTVITDDNAQLTVTPAATSVNEGSSLTFNVSTVNTSDQTLYYTATNAGDFATSSGSFSLANNAGSFSLTPTADTTTEGAETFTASVRTGSTSGDIVATSSAVTINDTSVASIVYPTGVEFQRASNERIRVTTFSSNVRARIQVVSAWFKLASSPTGDETILSATYSSDGNAPILFELTGGNVRLYVHTGNNFTDYQYSRPGGFTPGTWYHLLVKSNTSGSGRSQIWIDGVRVDDQSHFGTSTNPFGVGNLDTNTGGYGIGFYSSASPGRQFNGCIAQVYWYGGDIDLDANIAKFYNNGYVDMGSAGTSTGLPTPHIYHYGSTQATFDDVRGSLGGSSVTVTGTLSTCS